MRRLVARLIVWMVIFVVLYGQLTSIYGWGGWKHVFASVLFAVAFAWALTASGYVDWEG